MERQIAAHGLLAATQFVERLTIAYHQIVVLHWKVVGPDLICSSVDWRRKTYTAPGPVHARELTTPDLCSAIAPRPTVCSAGSWRTKPNPSAGVLI